MGPHTLLLVVVLLVALPSGYLSENWWKNTVIYQIYPLSFYDSDGDGVGDLRGIEAKASYLAELGVGAIWLNPIYKSPKIDNGYDISDFRDIDPEYGTMEDFEKMRKTYQENHSIEVILDFVPNHTSDQHEWFKNSVKRIDPYTDYYLWADPKEWIDEKPVPPNNWMSVLGDGLAWEWNDERQQFYYHAFFKEQVDLNFWNPKVIDEMKGILLFWLEKGVRGFRVDAVPYIFEDKELRDEPSMGMYTQNLDETYDFIHQLRTFVDDYGEKHNIDVFLTTEAYASPEKIMRYYGTEEKPGAHFPFNFALVSYVHSGTNAIGLNNTISTILSMVKKNQMHNWVSGNHDSARTPSRLGCSTGTDIMNMLTLLLPGTSTVYYGDEIGMDSYWSMDRANAPLRVRFDYRTPHRTPFQWSSEKNAGFTKNDRAWLPVHVDYYTNNVATQRKLPCNLGATTYLRNFKKMVELKKKNIAIHTGKTATYVVSSSVFAFTRKYGRLMCLVIINIGTLEESIDLFKSIPDIKGASLVDIEVKSVNMPSDLTAAKVFSGVFSMPPKSGMVLSFRMTTLVTNVKIPPSLPLQLASSLSQKSPLPPKSPNRSPSFKKSPSGKAL